ncbi:unnamed protein product [Brassica oleracea var. botrytis]|uniref:Uroporphyrinogen decarboxylase (URO-D) domain-containing protein n=1 Tax=Brassica oleracea var. oleracea TaxID=109376 RepID=A0A0D3DRK3_BRAOL
MKNFPALGHFANDRKEINEYVPSVNRTFLTLLTDLLLINIAKGQAGRYTAIYQKLALKHPSFRDNTDLIMVISLQPWHRSYQTMSFVFSAFSLLYLPSVSCLTTRELKTLGGQLTPEMWEHWSKPYIKEIIHAVKRRCSDTPVVFYINGNGGVLQRMLLDLTRLRYGRWKEAIVEWC